MMVNGWVELFVETIRKCVELLFTWEIFDVPVASYFICVSIIIILVKGFLYKIQG